MAAQKILLADDSVTIRKVVELTFADEGIDVVSVSDGDAAMAKFAEIQPDMVIADVNMPGLNGYQICETIKGQEATQHIPVILLVGSFEPFDPGEASRVGANYYFTKPFHSIRELVEKVSEYLALGGAAEPNEPETADIEHLYHQSFQDTLEMPEMDEMAETGQSVHETVLEDGSHPFDTAAHVEPETANVNDADEPAIMREDFDARSAAVGSIGGIESIESSVEETPSFMSESDLHPTERPHEEAFSVRQELGDAGMDDDIIETTHPGIPDTAVLQDVVVSPFDDRVDPIDPEFEVEKDAAMNNFDWSRSDPALEEGAKGALQDAGALKFVLDDDDRGPSMDSAELHVAPRGESEAVSQNISEANISPELIETIVRTVIERMSDRAVRETAQEAVPRIAEKLIREALDEDKRT